MQGRGIGFMGALLALAGLGLGSPSKAPKAAASLPPKLPIPPILEPVSTEGGVARFELVAQAGSSRFFADRATPTYGYNGMAYLGPTIRLKRGQAYQISLRNELPKEGPAPKPMMGHAMEPGMALVPNASSLHLHGLAVPDTADLTPAGCCTPLAPGRRASSAVFTPDQPSATLWYHPHPHMDTGRQVYWGLSGMLILDDPADARLSLPHTYGVDDLPLIVQDRRFKADRSFDFRSLDQDKEGVLGDTALVNGAISPRAEVAATRVRLRLLNASNRRRYLFAFSDGRGFQQIASDGGLLAEPAPLTQLLLAPAGRAEIVVDLSGDAGRSLALISKAYSPLLVHDGDDDEAELATLPALSEGSPLTLLHLQVGAFRPSAPLPAQLAELPAPDASKATVTRRFNLELGEEDTINGKHYAMGRVDETVKAGAWEIWTLVNYAPILAHPFHVHGLQFRILSRNKARMSPDDRGWKDTVRVEPHETVKLLMHFDRQMGEYMYHCHNLEHEDMGMMGTYEVVK